VTVAVSEPGTRTDPPTIVIQGKPRRNPFAGRDHAADGRQGGLAPRRPPTIAAARRRIIESRNGQANYQLLALEIRRMEQRDRAVYARDKDLLAIDELVLDAQQELHALDLQVEERRAELEALEAKLGSDDGLAELVKAVGPDRLEAVVERLGWFGSGDDDDQEPTA
jgi:hypothetical protein